ncbi:MAG: YbaK/EbsC family protein [Pseudomonadota bacterium]
MKQVTNATALRVQGLLGDGFEVLEFDESTRTADDAAAAIGCAVAQIAKSLLFRTKEDNRPVLVIASGTNRVDEKKVGRLLGMTIRRADADFVRDATGFAIGGVPPVGHNQAPLVLLDNDLQQHDEIWASGGTPNAVFKLTPDQLAALTGGPFVDVAKV